MLLTPGLLRCGVSCATSTGYIGQFVAGGNYYFNGHISNPRIYNRALSEQEITALYNKEEINHGLVGHWRMDEGEGDVVRDISGNGNHGTLEGGVTWSEDTP